MAGFDEMLSLEEEAQAIESERTLCKANILQSANEIKRAAEGIKKASDLLRVLKEAMTNMKNEARVVLFSEFVTVKNLIEENKAILERFTNILTKEKANEKEAKDRLRSLDGALSRTKTRLGQFNRVLQFPGNSENDVRGSKK